MLCQGALWVAANGGCPGLCLPIVGAAELAPSFQWDPSMVQAGHGASCASRHMSGGTRNTLICFWQAADQHTAAPALPLLSRHSHCRPTHALTTEETQLSPAPLACPAAGRRQLGLHGNAGCTPASPGPSPCTQQGAPSREQPGGYPGLVPGRAPGSAHGQHRTHSFPQGRKGSLPPEQQTGPVGAQGSCSAWALRPNPAPSMGETSPTEMLHHWHRAWEKLWHLPGWSQLQGW